MLARARAFVYYFNTERNAVYCVLYVFLFILYNTVFFIVEPWVKLDFSRLASQTHNRRHPAWPP